MSDCQIEIIPICETVQEVLKDRSKMFSSCNSSHSKNDEADASPHESGNLDGPPAHILHTETHRVQVGNSNGNSRENQNELDELTEPVYSSAVALESFIHKATCASSLESRLPDI